MVGYCDNRIQKLITKYDYDNMNLTLSVIVRCDTFAALVKCVFCSLNHKQFSNYRRNILTNKVTFALLF